MREKETDTKLRKDIADKLDALRKEFPDVPVEKILNKYRTENRGKSSTDTAARVKRQD